MKFIRALDADGATWGAVQNLGITNVYESNWSARSPGGIPTVVYEQGGDITMLRANDPQGSSWGSPVTLVPGSDYPYADWVAGGFAIAFGSGGSVWYYKHF